MKLYQQSQNRLFGSFSTILRVRSWPTYSSMSCERTLKILKKKHKNPNFGLLE